MSGSTSETSSGIFSPSDINLSVSGKAVKSKGKKADVGDYHPDVLFKAENDQNNPLITNIFCADPTSVEYNGRLYVYGTNDNQQYLEKGDSENTYECIKSFVIISTDDMVNWRYEGEINTAEIAPWIYASWAPSIVSRVEEDGLTHFYLYFSNSGAGVGVITATDPRGPWSDPLGKPLISAGMNGLKDCPNPFDPGVCIDDKGVGWLSFGGGVAPSGTAYMPGTSRICRLGADMVSIDSEIAEIPAPYFFEASELNYINGTYVYTYNSSWETRLEWDRKGGKSIPATCSMCYMTSKTPLNKNSWEYQDYYLKNPGELGMEYSNNHTHLQKFGDKYYLLFHTLLLQKERGIDKGFRSLCAYEAVVNEDEVIIARCGADPSGAKQIKSFDPYHANQAEEVWLTDCEYKTGDGIVFAHCGGNNVIGVKGVDFKDGSAAAAVKVKGKGVVEIRPDSFDSKPIAVLSFDCSDWTAVYENADINDVHDIFFVMSGEFDFDEWEFIK
ncbi:MAG: family 43 glycosylhydrolase [Oscillospiraceae bacterium]|nr:family 43 glycosylhydrolase [Oscillospiraceae bacterium]